MTCATTVSAQMPGAPVLQNAWATPGIVGALNIGGASGGSLYAGAGSWAPGSGRFALSAGFGALKRTGIGNSGVYGVRVAMPIGGSATSNIGFAAFAGVGGGGASNTIGTPTDTASTTQIPVGVAVGWRHAVGSSHGISLYTSPSYTFYSGGSKSGGLVRAAIGADIGITRSIGVTGGVEFGQTRRTTLGGPSGTLYGLGVAYAFGRR